ncbi:MAG: TIGR03009 domain-containing protein [Planctomycetota bacterium]
MNARIALGTLIGLWVGLGSGAVLAQYRQETPPRQAAAQPQRPPTQYPAASPNALTPRDPTLHRRGPQPGPGAPFTLSPQQQAEADDLLARWEQQGEGVKSFECKFTRFDWDPVWKPDQPLHIVEGEIRYAAPDKGMLRVAGELVDFRWVNGEAQGGRFVEGQQGEHWICDGASIFEYNFEKKQLTEHKLPPELQGKAISESPLPFLFGAKADQVKSRYFLRIVTPGGVKDQAWLEAWPKYQADAANFQVATLILSLKNMQPTAIQTLLPNGKSRTAYHFHQTKVNPRNLLDPLRVFENNWLHAPTPRGWTKVVEEAPQAQANRPSGQAPVR